MIAFGYVAGTLALMLGAWGIWRDIDTYRQGRDSGHAETPPKSDLNGSSSAGAEQ